MATHRRVRNLAAVLVAAALVLLGSPGQASAAPVGWFVEHTGATVSVSGTYIPIVGDFGGSTYSDILWYAPGSTQEKLWLSNGNGTFTKSTAPVQVNGTYTPVVGDFAGDVRDDIFWYGPGSAADFLWKFNDGYPTSVSKSISGTYTPVVLPESDFTAFTKDKIVWYSPGAGADSMWRFTTAAGAHTSIPLTIPGSPKPLVGDFDGSGISDVVWYTPGATQEVYWRATGPNGTYSTSTFSVTGTYTPIVYDLTPNTDGRTDIAWYRNGSSVFNIWQGKADGTWSTDTWSTSGKGTAIPLIYQWGYVWFWDTTGADRLWFLNPSTPPTDDVTGNTEIPAGYQPLVGHFDNIGTTIFWYKPGAAPEYLFGNA